MRDDGGAVTLGRVLTLVVVTDATTPRSDRCRERGQPGASLPGDRRGRAAIRRGETRLDAQIRVGGDAGAGEVIVLRLDGTAGRPREQRGDPVPAARHAGGGLVAGERSAVPAQDPVGRLAIRRITDATAARIRSRPSGPGCASYTPGDTDLAWSRITYWRALLIAAVDQPPHEPIESVTVSGLRDEPSLDVMAGWLAARLDCQVERKFGELFVELHRPGASIRLSRPQTGRTATLHRDGKPDRMLPLARRETKECLAEDLRRLDADEIYAEALDGLERVSYE